jgi:hypothetical protein
MRAFFLLERCPHGVPASGHCHDHRRRGLHGGGCRTGGHPAGLCGLSRQPPPGPPAAGGSARGFQALAPIAQQRALPRGARHRGGHHGRPGGVALRRKKDSSMRVAIQQVKDGAAQAAVSAGNTGALMAIARYVLKTLDGIDRPAIATQMPNAKGGATTVLDLGPMSTAAPSTCCSSPSWARPWWWQSPGRRTHGGPAQCRRRGDQGQRSHQAGGRSAAKCGQHRRSELSTATSRATTFSRAPPTSWSATVSWATWRSRPAKAWPR